MEKSQSASVLEAVPQIRARLETLLNQQDTEQVHAGAGSGLRGWSSFLYDQCESRLGEGEAQIFNFPYLY